MSLTLTKLTEKKQALEEELARTEKQIYDLEADFLQETLKEGNILRGPARSTEQSSSGAIRRIKLPEAAAQVRSGSSGEGPGASVVLLVRRRRRARVDGGGGGAKMKTRGGAGTACISHPRGGARAGLSRQN